MASTYKRIAGAITATTELSTEFNSLANNAGTAASGAIDNTANLDIEGMCELTVTFGSNPTADSTIDLYLIPSLDGTNYADYTSGTTPVASLTHYIGSFVVKATTSAQRVTTRVFNLPATKFKLAAINKSGQAFPSSGSVLKLSTFNYQSV